MKGFRFLALATLLAVGVGIGVEATVAPGPYGPPGHQFSASFVSPPRTITVMEGQNKLIEYVAHASDIYERVSLTLLHGSPPTLNQERVASSTICRVLDEKCGWVAYAPLANAAETAGGCDAAYLGDTNLSVGVLRGRLTYDTGHCGFALVQLHSTTRSRSWQIEVSDSIGTQPVQVFLHSITIPRGQ